LFGSTDEGQSKFLLHVSGPSQGKQEWKPGYYDGFNEGGNPEKNGLRYLSFSLKLKPNDRKAISPGREIITLHLHFKRSPSGKERCKY
jgi:hypothetical protein